jgi:hypothetical protein
MAKIFMRPMRARESTHTMPFDDTRVPTPFRAADDIDYLPRLENLFYSEGVTDLVRINVIDAKLPQ